MTEVFRRNIAVDNVADAATAIQAALAEAGWSTISGSPTSFPLLMASENLISGVRVFNRFTSPSANILRLNGDALGDGSALSTSRDFTLSVGSRLWLATDHDASCFLIKPSGGDGSAYHSGRLDALIPDDGWAWQIGVISTASDSSGSICQFAQGFNVTTKWQRIGANISANKGIYSNPFDNNEDLITGKPEIAPYFRFGTEAAARFRGVVKFAVTGLNHKVSGVEYEAENGRIYVATGLGAFRVA